MRTFNTHYTSANKFQHFVQTHKIEDSQNLLIQIFTSINSEEDIASLLSTAEINSAVFP